MPTQPRKSNPYYQVQSYVSRRDHSVAEIREKLKRKKFSSTDIEKAISWALDKGFLNDQVFTERYVVQTLAHKLVGRRWVMMKLKIKGIAAEIIERTLNEHYTPTVENTVAQTAATQWKQRHPEHAADADRLGRFLLSRGFGMDIVRRALEQSSETA